LHCGSDFSKSIPTGESAEAVFFVIPTEDEEAGMAGNPWSEFGELP